MHCCIRTPATDSNTSTGMIWATLNMPSAANRQGISHFCQDSGHPESGIHEIWVRRYWIEVIVNCMHTSSSWRFTVTGPILYCFVDEILVKKISFFHQIYITAPGWKRIRKSSDSRSCYLLLVDGRRSSVGVLACHCYQILCGSDAWSCLATWPGPTGLKIIPVLYKPAYRLPQAAGGGVQVVQDIPG